MDSINEYCNELISRRTNKIVTEGLIQDLSKKIEKEYKHKSSLPSKEEIRKNILLAKSIWDSYDSTKKMMTPIYLDNYTDVRNTQYMKYLVPCGVPEKDFLEHFGKKNTITYSNILKLMKCISEENRAKGFKENEIKIHTPKDGSNIKPNSNDKCRVIDFVYQDCDCSTIFTILFYDYSIKRFMELTGDFYNGEWYDDPDSFETDVNIFCSSYSLYSKYYDVINRTPINISTHDPYIVKTCKEIMEELNITFTV